jgi:hypothetical protein
MEHHVGCPTAAGEKGGKICTNSGQRRGDVIPSVFHFQREGEKGMNPRICICCVQPMAMRGITLSRNPNICASCSSILDGCHDGEREEVEQSSEESYSFATRFELPMFKFSCSRRLRINH